MKRTIHLKSVLLPLALGTLLLGAGVGAKAQAGLSGSMNWDILPYQDFDDPITLDDGSNVSNAGARLTKQRATINYPIIFSGGRTVLVNSVSYQLIEFRYRNLANPLDRLHSASYTLMLQHRMSQKWSVWALATPSMASDLGAEVSREDFNLQAATVFIRHFSERLSLGVGAAYSTQFGDAIPLPVLALDWNNGRNLSAKAILPVNLEFWYRAGSRLDLGLLVSGDGNNYHGDPAVYQVTDPELRYTMLTVGPAAKVRLMQRLWLNLEAGLIGLHRFEFYDGDLEAASYDLKPSQYVRLGVQFGG